MDIDYRSDRVIQCQGELALLDDDEVVHSIGSGNTDRLTSFFNNQPRTADEEDEKKADQKEKEVEAVAVKAEEENADSGSEAGSVS